MSERSIAERVRNADGTLSVEPAEVRFMRKVEITSSCHVWQGNVVAGGYGRFWVTATETMSAHRWAYQRWVGQLDPTLVIDHLCRNRRCVNPDHLRQVTRGMNTMAPGSQSIPRLNIEKSHCPKGHPYNEKNTYNWRGKRHCRICRNNRGSGRG